MQKPTFRLEKQKFRKKRESCEFSSSGNRTQDCNTLAKCFATEPPVNRLDMLNNAVNLTNI